MGFDKKNIIKLLETQNTKCPNYFEIKKDAPANIVQISDCFSGNKDVLKFVDRSVKIFICELQSENDKQMSLKQVRWGN